MNFKLFFCFITISNFIWAQELPQVLPQTPDAAALSKYNEYPIGNFTGIPEIRVPLYTIRHGDIELPIGLNYHAGGFRVEEEASWVGLGWTLSANGAITRTVKGVDDFNGSLAENTYPYHHSGTPKIIDIVDNCSGGSSGLTVDCTGVPGGNNFNLSGGRYPTISTSRSNLAQVNGEIVDYSTYVGEPFDWEPDIYVINFMGLHGKFVMDQEKNVHFLEKKNLEVKKTVSGWKVRENDGSQYFFEKKESSETFYGKEVNGSWYITKYVSPSKRELNFIYTQDNFDSWQKSYNEISTIRGNNQDISFSIDAKNFTDIKTQKVYLKRIEWDNGYIELNTNNQSRADIKDGKSLRSIAIFDAHNRQIREFEFDTDYFETNSSPKGYMQNLPSEEYSYYRKRLKLNKIIERSGENERFYKFSYSSINLPNKDSFSQDHWGYFNGRSNSSLLATFEGPLPFNRLRLLPGNNSSATRCEPPLEFNTYPNYRIQGSNRETNPEVIKANILQEIVYPTGGRTSFEFEANEYAANGSDAVYVNYTQDLRRISTKGELDQEYASISMPFDLPADSQEVSNAEVNFVLTSTGSPIIFNSSMWAEINSPNYSKRYYAELQPNSNIYSYTDTNLPDNITGPIDLSFNIPELDNNQSAYLTFRCRIKKKVDKKFTGGLRVKKIVHSDVEMDEGQMTKTYDYDYKVTTPEGQKELSYGHLKAPVRNWTMFYGTPASGCYSTLRFSSSFHKSLSISQSSHIGYSKIIENLGIDGENGRNVYTYHNNRNTDFSVPITQEFIPSSVEVYLDGKLRSKAAYNKANKKIHEKKYEYTRLDEVIIKGIFQDRYNQFGSVTWYGNGRFHYYPIFSRWEPITSITEYSYNEEGENPFEAKVLYEYNEENLLPSVITSVDSEGNHFKTKNYYPNDVESVNSLGEPLDYETEYVYLNNLKRKYPNGNDADFKTAIPVQVEQYKNEELLSTTRRNFKQFSNSSLTLPNTVEISKQGNSLEDRILYSNYDTYGNPLEVSKTDGTRMSYIYGYNNTQPVAKLTGISYSDIPASLINSIQVDSDSDNDSCYGLNPTSCSESRLRSSLNALRTHYSNDLSVQITTYTYDPLIGVTSITDPRGETSYYEYDGFNRLKAVKDAEGNLLEETKYNYRD